MRGQAAGLAGARIKGKRLHENTGAAATAAAAAATANTAAKRKEITRFLWLPLGEGNRFPAPSRDHRYYKPLPPKTGVDPHESY